MISWDKREQIMTNNSKYYTREEKERNVGIKLSTKMES